MKLRAELGVTRGFRQFCLSSVIWPWPDVDRDGPVSFWLGGREVNIFGTAILSAVACLTPIAAAAQMHACGGRVYGAYTCSVTQHPAEPGYTDVVEVTDPTGNIPTYLVKVMNTSSMAEVWYKSPFGGDWTYLGFWRPEVQGSDCIVPIRDGSVSQNRNAQALIDSDDWHLCVN